MYKKIIKGIIIVSLFTAPLLVLKSMYTNQIVEPKGNVDPKQSLYSYQAKLIDGQKISLNKFKGKKILFVNVASHCGYTGQYKGLQTLHEQLGDKVVVLGFPANNFGAQEPGSNEEIAEFCSLNYDVSFPMFAKISVKGKDMDPIYHWLTDPKLNGWNDQDPTWNFCKYLVNEEGQLIKFYKSNITPMSDELKSDILK